METIKVYTAIVGGGAAGLMCGCIAGRNNPDKRIIVIERDNRVGKKILVSGNSRCNLTNMTATKDNYNGSFEGLSNLLQNYPPQKIVDYFESIGLMTMVDNEKRVYPLCRQASAVLSVLRNELKRQKVEEICDTEVISIAKDKNGYKIKCADKIIEAEKVIIATGGKNNYAQKVIGDTFAVSKSLSHKITPLSPSLCPVKVKSDLMKSLKGIRALGEVTAVINGKNVRSDKGEIQFTSDGLSGICVFNISGIINKSDNAKVIVKLLCDYSFAEIKDMLANRINLNKNENVQELFTGLFHKNIGIALLKTAKIDTNKLASKLSNQEINSLANVIDKWTFDAVKCNDFSSAQVTRGGVATSEIDPHTFESKLHKGVYICGEALDVDGDCGGFNLQFAFSSGMCVGENL